MKEHERLLAGLQTLKRRILALSKPDPKDPYPMEREAAILEYNQSAEEVMRAVNQDIANKREAKRVYLGLRGEYLAAYDLCRLGFLQLVKDIANYVSKTEPGIDVYQLNNADRKREIEETFTRNVLPAHDDLGFTKAVENFDPKVNIASYKPDFTALEREIYAEVETKTAAYTASGPMLFEGWGGDTV
jgi:hypothetical protein